MIIGRYLPSFCGQIIKFIFNFMAVFLLLFSLGFTIIFSMREMIPILVFYSSNMDTKVRLELVLM